MKVLGIAGSPREFSNSTFLLKTALKAAELEGAETELVLLREKNIKHCDGSWTCAETGKCDIEDDMQELYIKLAEADGIISASPTQFGTVSSLHQSFWERTLALLRQKIKDGIPLHIDKFSALTGKPGGAIVTGRRRGVQGALDTIHFGFLTHGIIIPHGGVAGFCLSLTGETIKNDDPYAVAMSAEVGKAVVKYIRKLAPGS